MMSGGRIESLCSTNLQPTRVYIDWKSAPVRRRMRVDCFSYYGVRVGATASDGGRVVTDAYRRPAARRWWRRRRRPRSISRRFAADTVAAATATGRPLRPFACGGRVSAWSGGRTAKTVFRTRRNRTAWCRNATDSVGTVRRTGRNAKSSPATCSRTASRPSAFACAPVDEKRIRCNNRIMIILLVIVTGPLRTAHNIVCQSKMPAYH